MKKNDRIELIIEDMGSDGTGVAKWRGPSDDERNGMTFFVKDALI